MLAKVFSSALMGIDGYDVIVEVNVSMGMPMFDIVGLPDAAVKESRERVRAAIKNSRFGFPAQRLTVNLAPADVKKEGPIYDLPIALGILACAGECPAKTIGGIHVFGELSLDGSVRGVRGALPMVISAKERGVKTVMVPYENLREVDCISGIDILPVESLGQAVAHLNGKDVIHPAKVRSFEELVGACPDGFDFKDVKGQKSAKRALEIAAAGGHNALMIGEPGSGKTLMARCLPSILPAMRFDEALETTRIHSVMGSVPSGGLFTQRPFRTPHHSASYAAMVGGGPNALPGEMSRAHNGVLFLDEMPEYKRDVLEALRQPLEDGSVTVARVKAQSSYPARFMLMCSMNPCPCGNLGSRTRECHCTPSEIRRYLNRISGPLLDRIDLHIEVESIPPEQLSSTEAEEPSRIIRARVEKAREAQLERSRKLGLGVDLNARLDAQTLNAACPLDKAPKSLLTEASRQLRLSNRSYTRILKVSRTIADLAGEEHIREEHILEAVQYRTLDRKYWG